MPVEAAEPSESLLEKVVLDGERWPFFRTVRIVLGRDESLRCVLSCSDAMRVVSEYVVSLKSSLALSRTTVVPTRIP